MASRAPGLARLVDFGVRSHVRAIALLVPVSLAAFLPGLFQIPPVDRDEARFAQATRQMLETGDFVDIRFQDDVRYKKPVGIYWAQGAAVKIGGALGVGNARTTIWLYRMPSVIGAVAAVLLTYWAALAMTTRRASVMAAVMMATSILLGVEARLAKTDAMLLAACAAAMGALGRIYLGPRDRAGAHAWLAAGVFWTAVALGVLLKGPPILMFAGLAAAVLTAIDRKAEWLWRLKPLHGIVWLALLASPWFIAIAWRSGWRFFLESFGRDVLSKVGAGQEGHGLPPGSYLAMFWATFFPASMLAGLAAPAIWRLRREPASRFLLAWTIPSWIVLEIVATKLPHYVLPLYPAVAILMADVVDRHALSRRPWLVRGAVWWPLAATALALLVIAAPVAIEGRVDVRAWPVAAAAVVCAWRAWRLLRVDDAELTLLRASMAAVLLWMAVFGALLPRLPALFPAASVARDLRAGDCVPLVAAAGYHEPSLVFLAGTGTSLTDGIGAADFLRAGGCRVAIVERAHERAFALRAEAIGLRYGPGRRVEGFDITHGRRISLAIVRAEGELTRHAD